MTAAAAGNAPFTYVLKEQTRILVVDDDPIQREFARVYLATDTTRVDIAENAEMGLRVLANGDYDVALVDIDMPGMGGVEMVRMVRASSRYKDLPIVMVTGNDDIASIDRCYEAGATSFVAKPVNWRLLSYHLKFVIRAARAIGATS